MLGLKSSGGIDGMIPKHSMTQLFNNIKYDRIYSSSYGKNTLVTGIMPEED